MPTGSKGLINQLSNMVAPQVSGQGDKEPTWNIVTHKKKNKRKAKDLFTKEDFPPLSEPSSATPRNQDKEHVLQIKTKEHSPTKCEPKKVVNITPDIDKAKRNKLRAGDLKNDDDNISHVSSSTKNTNQDDKNSEDKIK